MTITMKKTKFKETELGLIPEECISAKLTST
jgi:hypothetical protein